MGAGAGPDALAGSWEPILYAGLHILYCWIGFKTT